MSMDMQQGKFNKHKKRNTIKIIITMVLFVLSFAATLQVKSVYQNSIKKSPELQRVEDLQKALLNETEKNKKLAKELEKYMKDFEELKNSPLSKDEVAKLLNEQLKKAEMFAGLTEVKGQGITLTLEDAPKGNVPAGAALSDYIVHDMDILNVVNILRDAGAEAISVNGHRLVSTSEIYCAGTVISVNGSRIGAPFEIKAIGSPDVLSAGLQIRDGIIDSLNFRGIQTKLLKKSDIIINKYDGSTQFKYAKPSGRGGVS